MDWKSGIRKVNTDKHGIKGRFQSSAARELCSSVPDLLLLSKSMSHASSDLDVFGVRGRRLLAAKPRAMVLTVPIARRLSGEVRT